MHRPALVLACALIAGVATLPARSAEPPSSVLFQDVRIFDGRGSSLSAPSHVLVRGRVIEAISTRPIPVDRGGTTVVIEGRGRTLMPGLIDAHWHAAMAAVSKDMAIQSTPEQLVAAIAGEARNTLRRGFTSVRDLSGPTFELKKAIDAGRIEGPRIWPSGAMISQTGGHGDFRERSELPWTPSSPLSLAEQHGVSIIADGVPEVLRRAREQLMLGASQLKLAAGGGVASEYDPIDVSQYTEAEFRAAVDAAENWGTYVTVHAYTPRAIQTAIRGGVKCIDHGQLLDEETAQLMAEKGIWLSLQPFLDDEDAAGRYPEGSANRAKQLMVAQGTDNAYRLAKKYGLKTAFGTDALFDAKQAARQGAKLAKLTRWYTPAEVLKMATSTNAELLALSGPRNPYPGRLGVVEEGALADLLLVEGNPLANIRLIEDPERNFVVIMKDGKIHRDPARQDPKAPPSSNPSSR